MYQLFHPIGGVSAIVSPQTILSVRLATPLAFFAITVTACSPTLSSFPVICPVEVSSFNPDGKPSAANSIGRSPEAAMVNRNGERGRTPNAWAPLIRGAGDAGGVSRM